MPFLARPAIKALLTGFLLPCDPNAVRQEPAAQCVSEHLANPMASQNHWRQRKRPQDSNLTRNKEQTRSAKRRKTDYDYSPQFWDSLSKVPLTRKTLREFDRRTEPSHPTQVKNSSVPQPALRSRTRHLEKFAENGGPDLSKLRGYADIPALNASMNQSGSQRSTRPRSSSRSQSPRSSSRSKRPRSSSRSKSRAPGKTRPSTTTYGAEFAQKAIDKGVYPMGYRSTDGSRAPKPDNIQEIRNMMAQSRRSLSPSRFSDNAFEEFQDSNIRAISESTAMAEVLPTITGAKDKQFYSVGNMRFNRLLKLDSELSDPKPDKYYGAKPEQISKRVRKDLDQYIIPSDSTDRPAAPNFFLEVKSRSGTPVEVQRQAMYDGWAGARGMFQLQNYGNPKPVYDGKAYTITATYHAGPGILQMYATHPKESASGEPEYYMTLLGGHYMIGTSEEFRKGAAAYRNARDWTKQQRDLFIDNANATASMMSTGESSTRTERHTEGASTSAQRSFSSDTSADELASDFQSLAKRPKGNRSQ